MNQITKSTKIGTQYSSKPKVMAEARVFAFSGGKFNSAGFPAQNIHTSLEFAKTVGLPTRAISATQYEGHLTSLLIDIFGDTWLTHGVMEAKFIALVDVGDVVTSKAVVTAAVKEGKDVRFSLDIWCENQHGTKVLAGTASCLVK